MTDPTADDLAALLHDLLGRSGVPEAIDECREFMDTEAVALLDWADERGREVLRQRELTEG
jgi:hypothetical protein